MPACAVERAIFVIPAIAAYYLEPPYIFIVSEWARPMIHSIPSLLALIEFLCSPLQIAN
nr:MAG TPA: hypothetical protein [Caudoviricetes sp.]